MPQWFEYSADETHHMLEMLDQTEQFIRDVRNHLTRMDRSMERCRQARRRDKRQLDLFWQKETKPSVSV